MRGILIFICALIFTSIAVVFAQDADNPIDDFDFIGMFISIPALAAGVVVITELVKKAIKDKFKYIQYISWLIAVLLSAVGFIFKLGIFSGVKWYIGLIYALSAGLIANGLFDWQFIQIILKLLRISPKKAIPGNR